ncbi:MAG: cupin domain-containing protein [Candidatus ainarchaeum sp.]|nr:cupin domain-containing protein [Candidatus ainarchaeum sp.]
MRPKQHPGFISAKPPSRFNPPALAEKLSKAPLDKKVGIRHIILYSGKSWSYHLAEVRSLVNPHVHFKGDEIYYVIEGSGRMHVGYVAQGQKNYTAKWEAPLEVKAGDAFIIPPAYAHSLQNTGSMPIVIIFRCPPGHLSDKDRFAVKSKPVY